MSTCEGGGGGDYECAYVIGCDDFIVRWRWLLVHDDYIIVDISICIDDFDLRAIDEDRDNNVN